MDRLVQVDYLDGEDEEFDYDKLGNRESIKNRDDETVTYAINYLTNRYDAEGTYDVEMEYDEAGNTTVNDDGYILVDELRNYETGASGGYNAGS